ncbi:Rrf2 family transcriptional regulator [uncultured Corynebacterium sp.]|uniref:RrF2 family transcriptional regulator n=1 Tax=uncultured Corynebacterium sp. TaxID=159447 RepID=UPI0025D9B9DF|nr:Rrf2 family transcriptional regulator [uncultured Corynebacterium sp.]
MQPSRATELGIRILMQLAALEDAATAANVVSPRHTSSEIAQEIAAPQTHVAKVVSKLAELGMVNSTRGRTGGIALAPEARSKRLGTLMRELEGERLANYRVHDPCPFDPECNLHAVLRHAANVFFDILDETTLNDLIPESPAKAKLV